jgi:hypothetical protein
MVSSCETMVNKRKKNRIVVELFDEKTGEKVRKIRFSKPGEFDHFLQSFKRMRYPGYDWRYADKNKSSKKTVSC